MVNLSSGLIRFGYVPYSKVITITPRAPSISAAFGNPSTIG
jgi:hypothetical protein